MLPSNCLDGGAGDFRNFLDCARPALTLDPGLLLIGDSDDCDVGLPLWGSTSCSGSTLPASSSASSISSLVGHASGKAGRLLSQSPSSSTEKAVAPASSAMCSSAFSGCSVLGMVGDLKENCGLRLLHLRLLQPYPHLSPQGRSAILPLVVRFCMTWCMVTQLMRRSSLSGQLSGWAAARKLATPRQQLWPRATL